MSDEEYQPEEGDYAITSCGSLGGQSALREIGGKCLGRFSTDAEAVEFAQSRMKAEQFWANIWLVSDHGNWSLFEG